MIDTQDKKAEVKQEATAPQAEMKEADATTVDTSYKSKAGEADTK